MMRKTIKDIGIKRVENGFLVEIVEEAIKMKNIVNALIYNLLLHEYLHALGQYSERKVRTLVFQITRECFGDDHITTMFAVKSPWELLKGIPVEKVNIPERVIEIVKDFEETDKYIV